jgi:hypothetical protein
MLHLHRREDTPVDVFPTVEPIATDLAFPEGPVELPGGAVAVVEVRGGTVTTVDPNGDKQVIADRLVHPLRLRPADRGERQQPAIRLHRRLGRRH